MGRWSMHREQQGFSEVEATVLTSQGRELPQGQDSPACPCGTLAEAIWFFQERCLEAY